ncbi:hypothetical protein B0H13DRAFT_1876292 [Mycena leptocephala]|nr:hypothetical protein B0H13DRAFT_1876292 [Mycena leptocephala]
MSKEAGCVHEFKHTAYSTLCAIHHLRSSCALGSAFNSSRLLRACLHDAPSWSSINAGATPTRFELMRLSMPYDERRCEDSREQRARSRYYLRCMNLSEHLVSTFNFAILHSLDTHFVYLLAIKSMPIMINPTPNPAQPNPTTIPIPIPSPRQFPTASPFALKPLFCTPQLLTQALSAHFS